MADSTSSVPVVPAAAADSGLLPERDVAPDERASGSMDGPRRARRLAFHVGVYAIMLIALAPFMRLDTAWTVDEGLYVYQVRTLQQGGWELEYWAESIDPAGRWFPLKNHQVGRDSYVPYVRSPVYPVLIWAATRVLGDIVGLHLLPILGALGAAVAAWLLASLVDRRVAPFAFWIAALGPVVINAYVIWAHSLSAAVAGLTAYAAIRALRDGMTAPRSLALCGGVASTVLLRSEGLLFAAAVAAVLGAVWAVRLVRRAANATRAFWLAGAVGATALTVNFLESRWVISIVERFSTNDYVRGDELPYLRGRLQGARHVLLDGSYYFNQSAFNVSVTVAIIAIVIAGLALRHGSRRAEIVGAVAMSVAVAAFLVRFLGLPSDTIPGIIPAWPIVIIGLLLFRWRGGTEAERVLFGIVVLEVIATLATQYTGGGGKEWGARYLSPMYPLIAALSAVALYRRVDRSTVATRRHLQRTMSLLALIPAIFGLGAEMSFRATLDPRIEVVEGAPGVVVTTEQWMAQRAFRTYPEHEWLHVPEAEISTVLKRLGAAGYGDVIVLHPLRRWATESSALPGGYRVRRDLGTAVYLTHG